LFPAPREDLPGCAPRSSLALPQEQEVVARNRVLVLLPQELLVDEQVHVRRQGAGRPALEDRWRVLLAAEHKLGFLLARGRLAPDRHGHSQHDRHHGECDEQRDHGVPRLGAQNCPAVTTIALLTR
jgi:hypothetical protein